MKAILAACVVAVLATGVAGCRSTSEFNPYVELGSYDTVVIEDFEGPGHTGYEFAERLARAFANAGTFETVLRASAGQRALRIRGGILRYDKGNAALKIKYGATMGNARFKVSVRIEDAQSGDFVGSLTLTEEFETIGPNAPRTQDVDELAERAARRVAQELIEERNQK